MTVRAKKIDFRECKTGDTASMEIELTPKLVSDFASYTGDYNPLHMDEQFAASTSFKRRVVHGMAYGSFISRLIGMDLPGEGALWASQSFNFLKPVFLGDILTISVEVTQIVESTRTLKLKAEAKNQLGETVMNGVGEVMLLESTAPQKDSPESKAKPGLALVTGGSRGIGAAIVRKLASAGHAVAFTYFSGAESAEMLRESILESGGNAWAFPFDAEGGEKSVKALLTAVRAKAGNPSVLVCNGASHDFYGQAATVEWPNIEKQIKIHVATPLALAQSIFPHMKETGAGSIVMIGTSYLAGPPPQNMVPYLVAKQGMLALMRSMAVEFSPSGIRVNMVSPSMTETELLSRVPPRVAKVTAAQNPLRRLALPKDVASAVAFLCSEEAAFINGHELIVSGGSYM